MSSLLTEAFKKALDEAEVKYSNNIIALGMAILVGIGCMIGAYVILSIPFTPANIVCILFMAIAIWVGAMVGYDKVKQLLEQMQQLKS